MIILPAEHEDVLVFCRKNAILLSNQDSAFAMRGNANVLCIVRMHNIDCAMQCGLCRHCAATGGRAGKQRGTDRESELSLGRHANSDSQGRALVTRQP